jgi:hypothetical protein
MPNTGIHKTCFLHQTTIFNMQNDIALDKTYADNTKHTTACGPQVDNI